MMDAKGLFRQAALEKLSSPERLDVTVQITTPAAWLALSISGALLVLAVAWSIFGSISIKVRGDGLLLRGGYLLPVKAGAKAKLVELAVQPGDIVREGDVIGKLDEPTLQEQLRSKEAEFARLASQQSDDRARRQSIIAQLRRQEAAKRQDLRKKEDLVARGITTPAEVTRVNQELTSISQQITSEEAALNQLDNQVNAVRDAIGNLRTTLASTEVVSPYDGRVLEVTAVLGNQVNADDRIALLEPLDDTFEAVIFIPAADGKKIKVGFDTQISPTDVKVEEFGSILGRVRSVGNVPVSPERMQKVLNNEALVQELSGKQTPVEVRVRLTKDESTKSGFKWSSSKGPPQRVSGGTRCSATITVERKRPISYVIPIIRKAVGTT